MLFIDERYAIGGIHIAPSPHDRCNVYVAWESEEMAKQGYFAITVAFMNKTVPWDKSIRAIMDYGNDVTHLKRARDLFPNIFK